MNYMKQVAEMLGVELNEEFWVKELFRGGDSKLKCKITEFGLRIFHDGGNVSAWARNDAMLTRLIFGDESIELVKPPFVPKSGKEYWTFINDCWEIVSFRWRGCLSDFMRLKCGMVFLTKEEARTARPRVYQELTGKEREGNE